MNTYKKRKRIGSIILIFLILILVSIYIFLKIYKGSIQNPPSTVTSLPRPGVEVTQSKDSVIFHENAPEGFPKDIPLEYARVTESYKAFYKDQNVTQYTVSYTSNKSESSLYTLYTDYFTKGGYTIQKVSSDKTQGSISATKDNDIISVLITAISNGSFVQLNILRR